jgi:uncharacterized repeat protein (TIGR01451 family)
MTARTKVLTVLATLAALLATSIPAAEARKVANPRDFIGEVTGGFIRIKTTQLDLGTMDPKIHVKGPITAAGAITIPKTRLSSISPTGANGVYFPDVNFDVDGTTYKIRVIPTHDWTGSVNPMTGAMNLRVRLRLEIRGGQLGEDGSCKIGSDSNPIDLIAPGDPSRDLRTNISGARLYDAGSGSVLLVNKEAAVTQTAGGCGPLGLGNGPINDALGLPSGSGNNEAQMDITWGKQNTPHTPIRKAVNAAFTTTPPSGITPVTVAFNGSSSFTSALTGTATSIASYRWDFTNDGTWDTNATSSPTASHTYVTPGTYTAKLRVTDNEGDFDEVTRTITVAPKLPDLALEKSHVGNFRVGQQGTYTLTVRNAAASVAGPTQGPVTIVDDLPVGMTYNGFTGAGWSCSASGRRVTCTNPFTSPLQPGGVSSVDLRVTPTPAAVGEVVNVASVSTPGEIATGDNADQDPTTVEGIDLELSKSHLGGAFQVSQVRTYVLDVRNRGTAATVGPTTLVDTLPAGLTYDSSAGAGWTCPTPAGQTVTCTRNASIPAGETAQLRLRVLVGGSPRQVVNTASVSTQDDVDPTNNSASDPTPIFATPDLAVTKTDNGELRVGAEGTYTLSVRNDGVVTADGTVTVTDELPAGLSFVSAAGTGWTCGEAEGTVTCSRPAALAAGAALPDVTLRVAVGPEAAPVEADVPEVANTARVGFVPAQGDGDPNPANDTSTATTGVRRVDLTMDKSHSGTFRVGARGDYTLSVRNRGTLGATDRTTVVDTLPEGMRYVNAEGDGWTCDAEDQTVTCTRTGAIPAGATAPPITLTVDLLPAAAPSKTNVATVSNPADRWPSNDSDSDPTDVTQVDLAIDKSTTGGAFRVGQVRTYRLAVRNSGIAATGATTVVDTLPAGLRFVEATGIGWSCPAPAGRTLTCVHEEPVAAETAMPPISVRVEVLPAAVPSVTNTATVSTPGDNNLSDNTDEVTTDVVGPDVAVSLGQASDLRALTTGVYEIDVRNQGSGATTGPIVVNDALPAGLTYQGAAGDGWACSAAGQQVTCTRSAALGAGSDAPRLSLRVGVAKAAAPSVSNGVTVQTPHDTNAANDAATLVSPVGIIDLAIDKSQPGTLRVGETGTYLLAVRNAGSAATAGTIRVVDELPAGMTPSSAAGDRWRCTIAGRTVTCLRGAELEPGEDAPEITIETEVGPSTAASVTNTATVATAGDAVASNDSDAVTGPVGRGPDAALSMRSSAGGGALRAGSRASYLLAVRNAGGHATTGATTVTTTLARGLSLVRGSGDGWSCSASGQTVTCTRSSALAAGARSDVTLEVAVAAAAAPTATTSARVRTPGDVDERNDTARDEARRVQHVDLAASLTHTGDFRSGGAGSYSVTARNLGSHGTVGPATATLTMGNGLTPTRAAGEGWTCALGTTVRCRRDGTIAAESAAPPITVDVEVGPAAVPQTTPRATVATADDTVPGNDSATDPTAVVEGGAEPATLTFGGGEIVVGSLPALDIASRGGGKSVVLAGLLSPNGTFTVPVSGLQSPTFEVIPGSGISASLVLTEDAVGTIDRVTGQIRLPLKLRLAVTGGGIPEGCGVGSAMAPIGVDALVTGGSGSLSGSPINSNTGAVTLVNQTFEVPQAFGCGALDAAISDTIKLPSPAGANSLILRGTYAGPAAGVSNPAPPSASQTAKSTSPGGGAVKVVKAALSASKKQRAARDGILRLTVTPTENATMRTTTSIKVAGVKKALKLKALTVKLRKGRPSIVTITVPRATQRQLRAALKRKRKIEATISTVVTGSDKKTEKRTTKVAIVG